MNALINELQSRNDDLQTIIELLNDMGAGDVSERIQGFQDSVKDRFENMIENMISLGYGEDTEDESTLDSLKDILQTWNDGITTFMQALASGDLLFSVFFTFFYFFVS